MRTLPVGTGSLLVTWQRLLLSTPRVLRLGVARSVLVERLSHRGHLLVPIDRRRAGRYRENIGPPINPVAFRPIDRVWPSDLKVDQITVVIEEVMPVRLDAVLGTFLDIWR